MESASFGRRQQQRQQQQQQQQPQQNIFCRPDNRLLGPPEKQGSPRKAWQDKAIAQARKQMDEL